MGIELELLVLPFVSVFGKTVFARFEIETHRGRLLLKWVIVLGITFGVYAAFGHWALVAPVLLGGGGATFHWWWCKRNGIHPLDATPRDRYYELRGWTSGQEWAPIAKLHSDQQATP